MRTIKFRTWNGEEMIYASNSLIFGTYYDSTTDQPLMQMTGLKDKNGVGIYEGDIFLGRYNSGLPQEVWFDYGGFQPFCGDTNSELAEKVEVIGNVWQNPELTNLKQKG